MNTNDTGQTSVAPSTKGAMLLIPSLLPTLQKTVSALHRTECARHGIDISTQSAIVDSTYDGHIRIESGRIPVIRVSAFWILSCAVLHDTGSVAKAMAKAVCVADKRMRATLSRLPPMSTAEWIAERKTFRATNNTRAYVLPEYSISTTVSITLTHGSESVTMECTEKDIPETLRAARLRLTEKVYANEQASDLLDMLALERENARVEVACEVKAFEGNRTVETLEYVTPAIPRRESEGNAPETEAEMEDPASEASASDRTERERYGNPKHGNGNCNSRGNGGF